MGASVSTPGGDPESILDGPALTPPTGVVPDFDDPPNSNTTARTIMAVCLTIGSIFFLLRTYSAWFVARKPRMSDYAMIPTFTLYLAFVAVFFAAGKYGHFVHQYDIRVRDLPHVLYLWTCLITLYAVELMMIKAVILLEWVQLFCPTGAKNSFWWTAHVLMGVNILFYLAATLALHLGCFPHARLWDKTLPGTCLDTRPLDVTSAFVNVLVDLGILLLPQRVIWKLRMSRRKRIGVSAVFGLGIVVIGFAGTRTVFTILHSTRPSESADFTYNSSLQILLFAVEVTLGIVIFCLPACPKAFESSSPHSSSSSRLSNWFGRIGSSPKTTGTTLSTEGSGSSRRIGPRSAWTPIAHKRGLSTEQYDAPFALHEEYDEDFSEAWLSPRNDANQYYLDEQYAMSQWVDVTSVNDERRAYHGMAG